MDAAEKAGGGPICRRRGRRMKSDSVVIGEEEPLLKKRKKLLFSNSSSRKKICGKRKKTLKRRDFAPPQPRCEKRTCFPRLLSKDGFSTGRFSFSTEEGGKEGAKKEGEKGREKAGRSEGDKPGQCREVMLVFSSFTTSAKAGSFFIFFSTWLMEYITVVWSRLLKSRPMLS